MARRIVSARRLTKRSRSADRVDDGSLHSSGAGTGAGQDARRGRGGAGGPSRSGAVWGANDARRRGTAAPSALRVVGAESSISLAITVGAAPNKWSPSHIITLIGGRRAHRRDSPPFTHTGRETSGYMSMVDNKPSLKNKTGPDCRRWPRRWIKLPQASLHNRARGTSTTRTQPVGAGCLSTPGARLLLAYCSAPQPWT